MARRRLLQAGAAVCAAPLATAQLPAHSRVALVIGNIAYEKTRRLVNAVNDARAMGALLQEAGFAVDMQLDVGRDAMRDAMQRLVVAARRESAQFVFFYYAGHGAQLEWQNYLIPVDARVGSTEDVREQCVGLGQLLADFARTRPRTFVLILDACRDDPFGSTFRPEQPGLSQYDAPPGTLLAFSTSPGGVAQDGRGANGLYTEYLVRELSVRATRIEDALKRVRTSVRVASGGRQVPWESTSLESDVYLFERARPNAEELERRLGAELAAWARVKNSQRADDWAAFLLEHPAGNFAEIAQGRILTFERRDATRRLAVAAAPPKGGTPELVIGPGKVVPVLVQPSPNPHSAGTYAMNRRYSVGDQAAYTFFEALYRTKPERRQWTVTRIDEEADRVEINGGRRLLDAMGNEILVEDARYAVRRQLVPAECYVGKRWTTRWTKSDAGEQPPIFTVTVEARERIRVPAGEFDAFRIAAIGYIPLPQSWDRRNQLRVVHRQWVVPGLNFFVRQELERWNTMGLSRTIDVLEMTGCTQQRWSPA